MTRPTLTRTELGIPNTRVGNKLHPSPYRGIWLVTRRIPLGPYSRTMPRALGGGGLFTMSEVPLRRGIWLVIRRTPLGPYTRPMPVDLRRP